MKSFIEDGKKIKNMIGSQIYNYWCCVNIYLVFREINSIKRRRNAHTHTHTHTHKRKKNTLFLSFLLVFETRILYNLHKIKIYIWVPFLKKLNIYNFFSFIIVCSIMVCS